MCAQRQGKPSRVFSTCLCSHALPCSGSLFHLPSNSFLRRWNGAGCCQIQGGKKRSSQGHGLVPVCGVLQVGLEWGAGTLSSGDIADKVDKFGLRLFCRQAARPEEAGGSLKTPGQTPGKQSVALLTALLGLL